MRLVRIELDIRADNVETDKDPEEWEFELARTFEDELMERWDIHELDLSVEVDITPLQGI